MKVTKFSKYIMCIFCTLILIFSLYLSINYSDSNILSNLVKDVYSKNIDKEQDEPKKNESSINTNVANEGNDMVDLLARLINGEARGEPYTGQVAVGAVILNRVKSSNFPNTISGVIYQNNQFSCIKDGQFDQPIDKNATVRKAAQEAMNGADPTNGALYFYNPSKTSNKYLYSLPTVATIGKHVFAREK